jgi:predicted nucleic acid-binding protein
MTFYADTSVLLKWHVDELGSRWYEELVESPTTITTTELSIVEVYSALNRLVREGNLTRHEYQELSIDLEELFEVRYALIPIPKAITRIASGVLERHPLRAYDSIHLASAIFSNQELVSRGQPGLTFLSADYRLLAAANAEGLQTFNPATAA